MTDKPIRVLLVDDEKDLVEHLCKRLKRRGLAAAGVFSGEDACRLVDEQPFDVVVLDLKMPGMSGLEVLERIKEVQPYLQVLMLTGHGDIEAALASGRLDALRFLPKPYDFEHLVEQIQEAYAEKRRLQREACQEELNELATTMASPREILTETERIRKKYEQ